MIIYYIISKLYNNKKINIQTLINYLKLNLISLKIIFNM
jgi:hypothetical protein